MVSRETHRQTNLRLFVVLVSSEVKPALLRFVAWRLLLANQHSSRGERTNRRPLPRYSSVRPRLL